MAGRQTFWVNVCVFPSTAVWILLLLALLITVGLAAIDERIALYPQMAVLLW